MKFAVINGAVESRSTLKKHFSHLRGFWLGYHCGRVIYQSLPDGAGFHVAHIILWLSSPIINYDRSVARAAHQKYPTVEMPDGGFFLLLVGRARRIWQLLNILTIHYN